MKEKLLLIRGLTRERRHWGEFVSLAEKNSLGAEVFTIDLPGFGDFHKLSSPLSVGQIAEFMESQLKARLQDEAIHVFAISLGAMVATELQRRYPKRFKSMVLANTSFSNTSGMFKRIRPQALKPVVKQTLAKTDEEREEMVADIVSTRADRHKVVAEWSSYAKEKRPRLLSKLTQLIAAATFKGPLSQPSCPTLLLGSDGDEMVSSECTRDIAEQWGLNPIIHPTAGHEICFDAGDWVMEQVNSFYEMVISSEN